MRKFHRRGWVIIAASLVAVAGAVWFWRSRGNPGQKEARQAIVESGTIEDTIEATGSVVPMNRVEIKPPIGGRIEKLLREEGDKVLAGQIIAWMSSNDRAAILDAARAQGDEELKRWQDAYKPTPIVAPLSGIVILRNVVVGQTVDPGTVLYAMADHLIVLAQVDESDIGRVKNELPARIVLDAYPNQPVPGRVFDILHEGKNVSNVITYGVKIKPAEIPAFFRSQMTANVSFILGHKENTMIVPSGVVQILPGGVKQVLVPVPNGKPQAKPVTTGIESGDKVEILAGLSPGEKVLYPRGRYTPQQGSQTSPLISGGRPSSAQGDASRRRPR